MLRVLAKAVFTKLFFQRRQTLLRVPICIAISIFFSACSDPNVSPSHLWFGESNGLVMGGNLRLVTERQRPILGRPPLPTVCTEPSPDIAIAFGRTLGAQATITNPNGVGGSGNFNATSTESVSALDGRTAGVLALRDGLYAACQSYANGVLGHDAYSIILSQYGNLLVALAGTGTVSSTVAPGPQETAIAALLVGCISEYDPTRLAAIDPDDPKRFATNPLLSAKFCTTLLSNIANGKLLQTPRAVAAKKVAVVKNPPAKNVAPDKTAANKAGQTTTVKVTTTKTITTEPPTLDSKALKEDLPAALPSDR